MTDLLIRNIGPRLKRRLEARARAHRHSLSEEAKTLIQRGLSLDPAETKQIGRRKPGPNHQLGTYLFSLLEDQYRGDDLVFEVRDYPTPPELE